MCKENPTSILLLLNAVATRDLDPVTRLRHENEVLRFELQVARAHHDAGYVDRLRKAVADQKAEIARLEKSKAALGETVGYWSDQCAITESKVRELGRLQIENGALREQVDVLEGQIDASHRRIDELEAEIVIRKLPVSSQATVSDALRGMAA